MLRRDDVDDLSALGRQRDSGYVHEKNHSVVAETLAVAPVSNLCVRIPQHIHNGVHKKVGSIGGLEMLSTPDKFSRKQNDIESPVRRKDEQNKSPKNFFIFVPPDCATPRVTMPEMLMFEQHVVLEMNENTRPMPSV